MEGRGERWRSEEVVEVETEGSRRMRERERGVGRKEDRREKRGTVR